MSYKIPTKSGVLDKLGVETNFVENPNGDKKQMLTLNFNEIYDHDNQFKIGLFNDEMQIDHSVKKEMRKNYEEDREGVDFNSYGNND